MLTNFPFQDASCRLPSNKVISIVSYP